MNIHGCETELKFQWKFKNAQVKMEIDIGFDIIEQQQRKYLEVIKKLMEKKGKLKCFYTNTQSLGIKII